MLDSQSQILITSIGWALVHFLWQGTLITLAYWVITRSIESIHAKYWTGMGLVILSLIVPIINFSAGSVVTGSDEIPIPLSNTIISHQQLGIEGLLFYFINASLPFIVFIWAFIVALLSIRLIRSWLQLAAINHECDPYKSNELKQYIKNISIKLDLPVIPFLKISKQVMVPAAYGMLKPTILLPLSLLSQIPRNQLEAIIKHELCHLKRNDFIHNIIQLFADIVLFFHPGIRWMNNDIRHVREQCCDQMVLSHDTEKLTYAKALTNIAVYTNGINLKHSVHIGINDGLLLSRVKFLLQNKSSQSSLMVFLPFLFLIVFAIILLQPSQNLNENSRLTQPVLNQQPESSQSRFSLQQKRMSSQQFYPKLDKQLTSKENNPASDIVGIKSKHSMTNIADSNYALNKSQLQLELTQDMQLNNFVTNDLTVSLKGAEYQSITPQVTPQQVVFNNSEQFSTANSDDSNLSQRTISLSDASITELASFEITDSIKPEFKSYYPPKYPASLWHNKIEQEVIATFKIQSNGRAYDINLRSQNNNFVAFEQSVKKAMRRWRFDIESLNDSTLQRTYQQIFSFNISEENKRNCESKVIGTRIGKSMPCSE